MRDIYIMRIVLYTLRCILLYRVNADMVNLLLLEKSLFRYAPPLVCSAKWARAWALWRRGGCYKKRQQPIFETY